MLFPNRLCDGAYMARKPLAAAILLPFLAPAAYLAWVARDMPHFGHLHDDSIYFVTAKSLAQGRGYRILSLPTEPFQTKYPPLWPLLLASIWKMDSRFPDNLKLAAGLAWLILPVFLGLAWRWLRRSGFGERTSLVLCGLLAWSPYVIVLSTSLLSDLLFATLILAAVLTIAGVRRNPWMALGAGILAMGAYLVKTAALPLLLTGPLWLVWRKKYRAAALFFCGMLPAVAWWMSWTRHHMTHARDIVSIYYTDYMRFQMLSIGWRDLPLVIWTNLDAVCSGIAGLVIFDLRNIPGGPHLARVLAIAAMAGSVRLARRRGVTPYHWFTAAYLAILLVWHFPPNERFLLPVFPLLVAGLAHESAHLAQATMKSWQRGRPGRMLAAGVAAALAGIAGAGIALNANAVFREFPAIIEQHRAVLASNRAAFAWIERHSQRGAFYAYDDAEFFLYTGRHAVHMPLVPIAFYRQDHQAMLQPFYAMPGFMREQHLRYLFLTAVDLHRDLAEPERSQAQRILTAEPAFEPVYRWDVSAIYRLKP